MGYDPLNEIKINKSVMQVNHLERQENSTVLTHWKESGGETVSLLAFEGSCSCAV